MIRKTRTTIAALAATFAVSVGAAPSAHADINHIKIGNRSQFVAHLAGTAEAPTATAAITGRPQARAFRGDRLIIRNG